MTVLLPVVAALASLLILPGWSFYFDVTPKVIVMLVGAALALALTRDWPAPSRSLKWFYALAGAQALAIAISTWFSTHPWFSIYGSTWRRSGAVAELAVIILAVTAAGRVRLRLWLRITVLASLPVTIYGIAQYFGIDPILAPGGYHFGEGRFTIVRPPATLGHAAYFATVLLYSAFAGMALAREESARAWKAAALGASTLSIFAIALSGTRAALLGLLIGAVFVTLRERVNRRWLAAAVILTAALAGFYISPAGEQLRARVFWSSEDMAGGARLMLWRDTLAMARPRWFAGYGPETFSLEFPRHQSLALARAYPDFYHESPHNIFLDALVSKGLLGLLPLMALAALGIFVARGPMGGAFIAILISQQFTSFTLPTELYFYLSLTMLFNAAHAKRAAVIRPRFIGWALAVPFAGFAIYLGTGDFLLGSARRALNRGDISGAGQLIERAQMWNANADVYFSLALLAKDRNAMQYAIRAARHGPRSADDPQNAWVNLAAFEATIDDAHAVEQSLRRAIEAAPEWYKPRWLLAQVLAREGRMAEAAAEANAAFERDGGKHAEVERTRDQLNGHE